MKKLVIAVLLAFSINVNASPVLNGESNTFLKGYEVNAVGADLYELSYEAGREKFTIEVKQEKNRCCYLVRSDNVEVMYFCNKNGMGMRKASDCYKTVQTDVLRKVLNPKAFKYQALLTCNKKDRTEALGLIACFFPFVVNEELRKEVFKIKQESSSEDSFVTL